MSAEIVKADQQGAMEVRQQVNQIQHLMKEVLQQGEHYGTVPGCGKKPTLLQPGAEKIAYMFHFVPTYEVNRIDLGNGHREYEVKCTLTNRDTGEVVGGGMGTCSTLESKYRYRWQGYGNGRQRTENPDLADTWNTVMKMAKKRAFVDAVKSTTAASDIFTQDIEDMPEAFSQRPAQAAPKPPDPRKHLWERAGNLKREAMAAGVKEEGIESWMAASIVRPDGAPKEKRDYTDMDLYSLCDYLEAMARDARAVAEQEAEYEVVQPELAAEEIPF